MTSTLKNHCGLWTATELVRASNGSDRWLATCLMNEATLSAAMSLAYPYGLRRTYVADFGDEAYEPVTFHATDDEMVLAWIDANYTRRPESLAERVTTWREVAA